MIQEQLFEAQDSKAGTQPARDRGEESLGKEQDGSAGDMKSAGTERTVLRWEGGEWRGSRERGLYVGNSDQLRLLGLRCLDA